MKTSQLSSPCCTSKLMLSALMDVLFNDTAKVSTESEAQAPQADSYSTTTRRTVSLLNEKTATSERSIGQL